jgi:hypothetical protein
LSTIIGAQISWLSNGEGRKFGHQRVPSNSSSHCFDFFEVNRNGQRDNIEGLSLIDGFAQGLHLIAQVAHHRTFRELGVFFQERIHDLIMFAH